MASKSMKNRILCFMVCCVATDKETVSFSVLPMNVNSYEDKY